MKYPSIEQILEASERLQNESGPFTLVKHVSRMTEAQAGTVPIEGTPLSHLAKQFDIEALSVGQLSREIGLPVGTLRKLIETSDMAKATENFADALQSLQLAAKIAA